MIVGNVFSVSLIFDGKNEASSSTSAHKLWQRDSLEMKCVSSFKWIKLFFFPLFFSLIFYHRDKNGQKSVHWDEEDLVWDKFQNKDLLHSAKSQ